jgi:hypothetical protein
LHNRHGGFTSRHRYFDDSPEYGTIIFTNNLSVNGLNLYHGKSAENTSLFNANEPPLSHRDL